MDSSEQLLTIVAVLLGALTTYVTNYWTERQRIRRELLTRWDDKKLDAYEGYIDRVRAGVFIAVELYEHTEDIRRSDEPESQIRAQLTEAAHFRGRAFERVMLLGGDDVVEAGHNLNAAALEVDWQATGKTPGSLEHWRDRNRAVFRAINAFHQAARDDLGVSGSVVGETHPERGLLLPPARRGEDR
ncbi:hypothetical protein GA0115240_142320 [Streptomyces sp. DvalAA-14]|uniref:hypothetical protein n=1 Tax=unclassified Streptomyces TaxID=2593676 RepID=UPI00081B2472|nr:MULTISPECIES: hypothetical protein [unclassified Streptomyces]MYS22583.1 hypothetical protein [Streptomyces sp. SID4948]SCE18759.1 hypothetical protein GA0115240_142320 [Streptomyces sp. DvalAA-14]